MKWLLHTLKIYLEEQLRRKHCVMKHLTLLKAQNMTDIILDFLQWFANSFRVSSIDGAPKNKNMPDQNLFEELHKLSTKKFEKRIKKFEILEVQTSFYR